MCDSGRMRVVPSGVGSIIINVLFLFIDSLLWSRSYNTQLI